MPQMNDITVKKADGTTNIVWTALTPSAGDTVAAQWRSNTVSTTSLYRPTFSLKSQYNGPRTARRGRSVLTYPVLNTVNGVQVVDYVTIEVSVSTPLRVADADIAEAVAQHANLQVSTLILDSWKTGFAPT